MKKKIKLGVIMMFIGGNLYSQTTYIDIMNAPAMMIYASNIKNEQENTVDKMEELKEAQGWVAAQMTYANNLQDKLYKGLREVNGTVRNGLQIKRIYTNLEKTVGNIDAIQKEIRGYPEYSVFATKAINNVTDKVIDIYSDAADIINDSDTNLATAGDRRRLLGSLETNTRVLNIYLMNVRWTIKRAKRKGWWNSINPFSSYVETDKAIFNRIITNSGYLID